MLGDIDECPSFVGADLVEENRGGVAEDDMAMVRQR